MMNGARLRFLRKAKGRHGIHSPFVYRFIEDGLQPRLPKEIRKALDGIDGPRQLLKTLVFRCLHFFKPEGLACLAPCPQWMQEIAALAEVKTVDAAAAAIITGDIHAPELRHVFEQLAGSEPCFLITGIHLDNDAASLWEQLCADARVNLSIDLWHAGLLFYRNDFKEKQHFLLKYPV